MTLIDFTLSRLERASGQIAFSDLSTDPELFQGPKGDPQVEHMHFDGIAASNLQRVPCACAVCNPVEALDGF